MNDSEFDIDIEILVDSFTIPPDMCLSSKGDLVYTEDGLDNPLLAVFSSLIRGNESVILENVKKVPDSMLIDLFILMFYTRDIREGNGERDLFYTLFSYLWKRAPSMCLKIVDLIPHYGSWFDMYRMFSKIDQPKITSSMCRTMDLYSPDDSKKDLLDSVVTTYVKQLILDYYNTLNGTSISLAGKWAPREGKHNHWFAKHITTNETFKKVFPHMSPFSRYRKIVSTLNKVIKPVETYMCADSTGCTRFKEIDFEKVPSLAMRKYRNAFMKCTTDEDRAECSKRFYDYLDKVYKGNASINGKLVYPHEFVIDVEKNRADEDKLRVINAQWNDLVKSLREKGSIKNTVVMADFSGSMSFTDHAGVCPIHVSMGLALLISEITEDAFANTIITFDSNPHMLTIPSGTLETKLKAFEGVSQGTSTNFQKALELVLDTLKRREVPIGSEPRQLIVLTDMGWDAASDRMSSSRWESNISRMKRLFREEGRAMWGEDTEGWKPPVIVIWNLSGLYKNQFHHKATEEGVCLISCWNSNLIKQFMDGDDIVDLVTNPAKHMYSVLRSERYYAVMEALL